MDKKVYKSCFVPGCKNMERNSSKILIMVPTNDERRKSWFRMVRRDYKGTTSRYYCSEDHFNVIFLPNHEELLA